MKERVLEILKSSDKALSLEELDNALGLTTVQEFQELQQVTKELTDESILYHSNKDRYMLIENSPLIKGILRANRKGFGFVEGGDPSRQDDDIYISQENMNGAIHGDEVLVEVTSKKNVDRKEGRVLRIVKRNLSTLVGEINFHKGTGIITPDDKKIKMQLEIPRENALGAVDGHKVLAEITKNISGNRFKGRVLKILGHKNDPGIDILSVVYKYKIDDTFNDDTIKELDDIPEEVSEEEMKGRTDLRNQMIFTIDGDDTKDIDDAISIKKLQNGNYELGVHIADVSYYVKEGSAIDQEAMERGTSVYLVDRVIPMLPHKLSNGICSLNPGVDRLAVSCVMEINHKGKVVNYNIFPSVIRSNIQMTYKKVNMILEQNQVPEGYEPYKDALLQMKELADIIRKEKHERGYIDFDVDEAKILVDENCHPTQIVKRERGAGEKLIEDFMIVANETVATHIYYMNLPFIYRVHEYPKEEKIRGFLSFVSTLGYHYNGNLKDLSPRTTQKLLDFLKDKKEYKILSSLLLRCMQKAVYKPENLGHYGLASKCYTHFTSPIRRYPDTTVHRLLHTYLFDGDISSTTVAHWEEKLPYVAELASSKEMASVNCEREVEDMKMAEYMEDHIGEEYEGMISSVMSFGMFIELDNLVEGLVHISEMDDFYHYDETTLTLTGEKTHKVYRIGDRVKVRVVKASREDKTIDFEIVGAEKKEEKKEQKKEHFFDKFKGKHKFHKKRLTK